MSLFLDTSSEPTYGIGLCARCSKKFPLGKLFLDPNNNGLRVCSEDLDDFDPYRLAARGTESALLPFVRPDDPLTP